MGHVMNYLQLRYTQVNLDWVVARWNERFNTKIPGTNNAMTSWLNHYTHYLGGYRNETLFRDGFKRAVHQVVDLGRYKLEILLAVTRIGFATCKMFRATSFTCDRGVTPFRLACKPSAG